MKVLKNIFSQLHIYVAWIILSSLLWGWIFMLATDTSAAKKITVFAEVDNMHETELALFLEKDMPEKLKMIKVHKFSYAMFDSYTLLNADIYIVGSKNAEKYIESFAMLDEKDGFEYYYHNGVAYGIKIFDRETKKGNATKYISYGDDDYYLFFGVNSVHLGELNGSADDYSFVIADNIMKIY